MPSRGFRIEGGNRVYHDLVERDGLYVREGFGPDLSVYKEWPTTYRYAEPFMKGASVLDIGANIGIFSRFAMNRFGATSSVCYEPDPGAFSVLKKNVPKGLLINKSVGEKAGVVSLSVAPSGNTLSGSTVFTKRGRQSFEVEQHAFLDVVEEHSPSLLKSDCEGAELFWLNGRKLPGCVQVVTAELHREEEGFEELCQKVIRSFSKWREVHKPKSYSFHRCWIVTYERK